MCRNSKLNPSTQFKDTAMGEAPPAGHAVHADLCNEQPSSMAHVPDLMS